MSSENAVENFREYLRIKSAAPDRDFDSCLKFLAKYAERLGVEYKVMYFTPEFPIFFFSIPGTDPSLPSLLLNSHMDVVPVLEEKWTKPAWEGYFEEETGNIYGRGTQDMKSVTIQHLEALLKIKKSSKQLLRTVHLAVVPDEEV
jgi:aminoacylase